MTHTLSLEEEPAILERTKALQDATIHVKQAAIQYQLTNQKIQESIDSSNHLHEDHHYTFIADYCQNLELPFLGESQPGET